MNKNQQHIGKKKEPRWWVSTLIRNSNYIYEHTFYLHQYIKWADLKIKQIQRYLHCKYTGADSSITFWETTWRRFQSVNAPHALSFYAAVLPFIVTTTNSPCALSWSNRTVQLTTEYLFVLDTDYQSLRREGNSYVRFTRILREGKGQCYVIVTL